MSFTSIGFFCFILLGLIVYYILPGKVQWVWLLVLSYVYYFSFSVKSVVFMILATVVTYLGALALEYLNDQKNNVALYKIEGGKAGEAEKNRKKKIKKIKKIVVFICLLINVGMLYLVKYTGINFGAVLGISYYVFQASSYVIDIYREKYKAEKNPFKVALFVAFFPQLLQGPIGRFDKLGTQLFAGSRFNLVTVQSGALRVLWGIFKKNVISDRAAVYAQAVFAGYTNYGGLYNLLAVLLYTVWLYMSFSGGMDIVIGVAQMFGIKMSENFRQPFFSKSVGEFWRRWHITLGEWMKEYLFYPLVLSGVMIKVASWLKKISKSQFAKTLPAAFATFVIFIVIGVWHGSSDRFFWYGVYNGVIIASSSVLKPVYTKIKTKLGINDKSKLYSAFQVARTFLLVEIGLYSDLAANTKVWLIMLSDTVTKLFSKGFEWSVVAGTGLMMRDLIVIVLGMAVVIIVSILKEKNVNIREKIASKPLVIRWTLYYGLIIVILLFGYMGKNSGFIYAMF